MAKRNPINEENQNNNEKKQSFFPFGTPFSDVIKFTSEVEVFTKHIDTFSRRQFQEKKDVCNSLFETRKGGE